MENNYVVYHLHTELSLLDSCTNYKLYVDKAKELNQKAICFSEHGNVYNWISKKLYCNQQGLKYIHGTECYLTETIDNETKIKDNYHTILIAKNIDGVKEINSLLSISSMPSHKYYKNRITFEEFFGISDNVYKISACLASPLNKLRKDESKKDILHKLLSAYDYYEIQPHINSQDQIEYNQWLYNMSLIYNKPLIAGTDTHSLDQYKSECRKILKLSKKIEYEDEDSLDLTYKSYDELCEMFTIQNAIPKDAWMQAIQNTNIMADSVVDFEIDRSLKYPILYGKDDEKIFKQRINKMYKDKINKGIIKPNPKYRENLREEMRVFKKTNMIAFMLFMSEMIEWCWKNNIPIGFCRGSVGGSTTAYITDITDVDPIVWNTVFSRFCNEDRAGSEIGDIDIDISPSQRELVQNYILERFGEDKTAFILTTGTIADKGVIDDVGRAMATLWERSHPNNKDNPYSLSNIDRIKKEYSIDSEATKEKYKELFYYFDGLLGTVVSQSMHPAGVIASPITLPDNYGIFYNDEGKRILMVDMEECHELQLAKYDCLGLKNIEIIKDTCEYAGISYPKSHEINWNDENVWKHITDSPVGIFQFEGDYAFRLLKDYQPTEINSLSLINASLRPSGESYRDDLISHKPCINPSPIIDDLLKSNGGYLVFQEDTIKFLTDICGLTGSEADNVRRAIGRKQTDRLEAAMPRILEGYCEKSPQPRETAEKEAQQFLQIISDSSNYQFGYNHSTGYSMIGYLCGYLRYYYPIEFIAAYLKNAGNESDKKQGTELAKQRKISIKPIKFRYSNAYYNIDKSNNTIYKGISSVKYMNVNVSQSLYQLKDMQFSSFIDFLEVNPCNSRQTEILIKLDFFSEFGKSQKLLKVYDLYKTYGGKQQISKEKLKYPEDMILKYATTTAKMYKFKDMNGFLDEVSEHIDNKNIPIYTRLNAEKEYYGYLDYTNPKAKCYYYIIDINTKYSPKFTLYSLETGETITAKMYKKDYDPMIFNKETIMIFELVDKPKSKLVDGKWQKQEETEKWINKWKEVII